MYHVDSQGIARTAIVRPGDNAWRSEIAGKVAFPIDGASYFAALEDALRQARHSVWIVGWDFDPEIRLRPDVPGSPTLGAFLLSLVEADASLEIRILVWAMGPVYSGKSLKLFRRKGWAGHPRIHLNFDARHPLRGSHHQKIVCIDDAAGFVGGIDLTARRWDDSSHRPGNPLRVTPGGEGYEPVHDMQAAVSGAAARMLGDPCRERWRATMGETVAAADSDEAGVWPAHVPADLTDCPIAIARTEPATADREGVHESVHMLEDALRSARRSVRRSVYIEAQYLAAFNIADILIERLARQDGPEVLIVVTRISHGFIEKVMMGNNRDRLIRRLKRADPHDRLRVMYAVVPSDEADGEQEVLVHSKLVIVEDRFLRLGSSNLNNRSEGLDTEADMAIESSSDAQSSVLADLRHRLVAEHLGSTPQAVAEAIRTYGSLHDGVDALNTGRRGLRHFPVDLSEGGEDPMPGTEIVDPPRPVRPFAALRRRAGLFASRLRPVMSAASCGRRRRLTPPSVIRPSATVAPQKSTILATSSPLRPQRA